MKRRPLNITLTPSSAASDVYKRQEKTHPQHQLAQKDIRPENAGIEKIPEKHLAEGHEYHQKQQEDEQSRLGFSQPFVELFEDAHGSDRGARGFRPGGIGYPVRALLTWYNKDFNWRAQ